MKKIIAMLLALVMICGLATVAFAADEPIDTSSWTSAAKSEAITLTKVYTVTGATDTDLYPTETLSFAVEAASTNPDATKITVDNLVVAGNSNQTIKINLPSYSRVGVYEYTITENAGNAKAVGYTNAAIGVTVLVEYDYTNSCLKSRIVLSPSDGEDGKIDTFTNTYDVGHLTVSKTVTGNLGAKDVYFEMTVTLTSDKPVESAVTVTGGSKAENPTTIAEADWTDATTGEGEEAVTTYTAVKTIYLKDGETLTFSNIPDGVTYTVVEAAKHGLEGGTLDVNSATDTDYTVTYANESGTIADTSAATVTNNKETTVATGVVLDSMPYVLILAVAMGGLVLFTTKKRVQE